VTPSQGRLFYLELVIEVLTLILVKTVDFFVPFRAQPCKYLDNKFQNGQESGHQADPEKVSRDTRYARRDNGEQRFDMEEFSTAEQIQSYFSRTAAKLKHAVTTQSGHDSIGDNDSQADQEQAAYSSARLAVLHQFFFFFLNFNKFYLQSTILRIQTLLTMQVSLCYFTYITFLPLLAIRVTYPENTVTQLVLTLQYSTYVAC